MARSTSIWRGKTDDAKIPDRVRLRLFLQSNRRCSSCRRKIGAGERWALDHRIALINDGKNEETNLQVLCDWCHDAKTVKDVAEKSKTYHGRLRHHGIRKSKWPPMPGTRASGLRKRMDGRVERR